MHRSSYCCWVLCLRWWEADHCGDKCSFMLVRLEMLFSPLCSGHASSTIPTNGWKRCWNVTVKDIANYNVGWRDRIESGWVGVPWTCGDFIVTTNDYCFEVELITYSDWRIFSVPCYLLPYYLTLSKHYMAQHRVDRDISYPPEFVFLYSQFRASSKAWPFKSLCRRDSVCKMNYLAGKSGMKTEKKWKSWIF